ncbi:MAG: 50S ribosomal protein L10 [Candidatus Zixiibacteriota bacterium]
MPKPIKLEKVAELKKQLEESKSIFITDYTGLNVADITVLRRKLRNNSVKYFVAKNTLIKIAAKETGYDGILDYLQGQTAIAFAKDDPAIAAKILYDSFKDIEKPVIKAFVLENETFAGTEVKRLAELPSREVLLSQIVSAVEAPLASVIASIDAVFHELIATVDALAISKE